MAGAGDAVTHVGTTVWVSAASISIVGVLDAVVAFGTVVCVSPIANDGTLAAVVVLGTVTSVNAIDTAGVLLAVMQLGTVVSVRFELDEIVCVEAAVVLV